MTTDVRRLAELLASYEADEPHVGESIPGRYPAISWETIARWLATPHGGDCLHQAAPCPRCHAEHLVHKAGWLADRLGSLRAD